jgi:hypothetical protein
MGWPRSERSSSANSRPSPPSFSLSAARSVGHGGELDALVLGAAQLGPDEQAQRGVGGGLQVAALERRLRRLRDPVLGDLARAADDGAVRQLGAACAEKEPS